MLEIKITGLDHLADAIFALAGAMSKQTAVQTGTSEAPQADPVEQTAPTQQPAPQPDPEPVVPAEPQKPTPAAVPTSQQTYTLDDLARAGMTLMDSGRQADLQGLLKQFGVEALPALPQEQYGSLSLIHI